MTYPFNNGTGLGGFFSNAAANLGSRPAGELFGILNVERGKSD
jgi:hypothetical protein